MGPAKHPTRRAVIVAGGGPRVVSRLILEVQRRCLEVEIVGVVHLWNGTASTQPHVGSLCEQGPRAMRGALSCIGHRLLDFVHGGRPESPDEHLQLRQLCDEQGIPFHHSDRVESNEATDAFVASLACDVGLFFDETKLELAENALNLAHVYRVQVPSIQTAIDAVNSQQHSSQCQRLSVPVFDGSDHSACLLSEQCLPIHQYDTPTSLFWKSRVIGIDLLTSALNGETQGPGNTGETLGSASVAASVPSTEHRVSAPNTQAISTQATIASFDPLSRSARLETGLQNRRWIAQVSFAQLEKPAIAHIPRPRPVSPSGFGTSTLLGIANRQLLATATFSEAALPLGEYQRSASPAAKWHCRQAYRHAQL